jgi:hypothetical protein
MPVFEENWGCESSMTKDEKLDEFLKRTGIELLPFQREILGQMTEVKSHVEDHITIIDSARLVSMSIVPEHGVADENLKVRRVENQR